MRRLVYLSVFLLIPFLSIAQVTTSQYQRCATMEYLGIQMRENPKLAQQMELNEQIMQNYIQDHPDGSGNSVTVIPVVVHVIWNTASQNISDNMIHSQIRVLNEDFRRMQGTPGYNTHPDGADTKFEFRLADRDPNGNSHTGINRVQTTVTSWNYQTQNAQLKALSYWPSANYLNLWVANLSGGVLGYAQFPGGTATTDGVVILWSAFGYNSPAFPYHLGRTATHEIGHWLWLYHTFQNGCTPPGDQCDDTPYVQSPNFGCPTGHVSCSTVDMIENYMDYSDDVCFNVFTNDQTDRFNACYTNFRSQLNVSFKEKMEVTSTGVDYTFTTPSGAPFAKLNFSSLGTADSVTVEVWPRLKPLNIPPGSKAVNRYFDIKANGTGYNATLTVYYDDSEVIGFINNDNNLKLWRFNGSGWDLQGGTVNTVENTVTLAGVTEFSLWALSDPDDNPIPVELSSFTSFVSGNIVNLTWITATETNSSGFEIHRASVVNNNSVSEWEAIGFVEGQGTTTQSNYYSYSDAELKPGNYMYRLKIIDLDGSFEYSNTVYADIEQPAVYSLAQNYPNPFNPVTLIQYQLPEKQFVTLKIYDALGVEVANLLNEEKEAGIHEISFDASSLTSGVYFYTLQSGAYVQTNKMLLLK